MTIAPNSADSAPANKASGGCQYCDLGIPVHQSADGTPWHDMRAGSEVCEKPEGAEATRKFVAAMRGASN